MKSGSNLVIKNIKIYIEFMTELAYNITKEVQDAFFGRRKGWKPIIICV